MGIVLSLFYTQRITWEVIQSPLEASTPFNWILQSPKKTQKNERRVLKPLTQVWATLHKVQWFLFVGCCFSHFDWPITFFGGGRNIGHSSK
jgi:hypothetical protein